MNKLPSFVDMAKSPAEIKEDAAEVKEQVYTEPLYPYGLSICFTQEELDKLDLDDGVDVGDMLHIHAIAKVTSVSSREISNGEETKTDRRVELTLTHIAAEDEDQENEEAEQSAPRRPGSANFYR